jgi:hypothetical protein
VALHRYASNGIPQRWTFLYMGSNSAGQAYPIANIGGSGLLHWPGAEPYCQQPYCVAANDFRDTNGTRLTASLCDPYNSQQWWALG